MRQRYPTGKGALLVTVTVNVTVPPTCTVWLCGCSTIVGGPTSNKVAAQS